MKTIQMTLDEELLERVDALVKQVGTTRSAFAREALREALHREEVRRLEDQQREGYARHPVVPGEFDGWDDEQAWGE
jgi:metal-responsive CopG/Arc/MetJ family transcriptional regulator